MATPLKVKSRRDSQRAEYRELPFKHIGKSVSLPSATSRTSLETGSGSKPKTEVREPSEMVFIATRLAEITPGGSVDGKVLGSGLSDE